LSEAVKDVQEAVLGLMDAHLPTVSAPHDWDLTALDAALERDFNARWIFAGWLVLDPQMEESALRDRASRRARVCEKSGAHRRADHAPHRA